MTGRRRWPCAVVAVTGYYIMMPKIPLSVLRTTPEIRSGYGCLTKCASQFSSKLAPIKIYTCMHGRTIYKLSQLTTFSYM